MESDLERLALDTINEDASGEATSRLASSRRPTYEQHDISERPKGSYDTHLMDLGPEEDDNLLSGLIDMTLKGPDLSDTRPMKRMTAKAV